MEMNKCTGCGLCSILCPANCIEMKEDEEGFRYPNVRKDNCIECDLCLTCCPLNFAEKEDDIKLAFAAKNRNLNTRMASSSGGIFSALAEQFILDGGIVCAAKYDETFTVVHSLTDNLDDIAQYRGAKYCQSSVETLFERLKNRLQEGIPVVFVGTPCQIVAFKVYLGNSNYSNLLLVDMICHGIPSPMVWKRYCEERKLLDANGARIKHINLRNKDSGWSRYKYSVEFVYENDKVYKTLQEKDSFMRGFVNDLFLRPSCSDCKFKGVDRQSDLTIGDFWGIWERDNAFDDNQGVSALIVNSQKGKQYWEDISGSFDYTAVALEDIIAFNPSMINSSAAHPKRSDFFKQVKEETSIIRWIEECLTPSANSKESLISRIMRRVRKYKKL